MRGELQADLAEVALPSGACRTETALGAIVRCVPVAVPLADGASVTIARDGAFETLAASDPAVIRMDQHQYETGDRASPASCPGRWSDPAVRSAP